MVAETPLLALFGHPDDEFGIFPWLQSAREAGREVHCLWLTDGGWGGQDIARRNAESVAVLEGLGLAREHMHFLGAEWQVPDGELHLRLGDVVPRLRERFGELAQRAQVLLPAWEGGHQDHDATHLAGLALAAGRNAALRQYSLYHGAGLPGPLFRVLAPLPANGPVEAIALPFLRRLGHARRCLSYGSQWRSFVGLLPFYLLRMLRADAFVLQAVDATRTAQRPHAGPLLYERRGALAWEDFAAATRDFRAG